MAPTVGADPEHRPVIVARDLHLAAEVVPAGTPVRLLAAHEHTPVDAIREMIAAGIVAAYDVEGYGVRYLGPQSVTHDAPTPATRPLPPGMWTCACGARSSTSHKFCRTCAQPRPTPYAETTPTPTVNASLAGR